MAKSRTILPDFTVNKWEGLNTYIKDLRSLKDGETPESLNWITGRYKDHIELRRGSALLGTNRNTGGGRISGLGIGYRRDGLHIPFFSYGRKIFYYDVVSNTTIECGTDILPAIASGEDICIEPYQNIAGDWVYFGSPNSGIYKVPTANPGSVTDMKSTNFKGHFKIDSNAMFLWNRIDTYGNKYTNILYSSYPEAALTLTTYTNTKGTAGTGDGVTKTFTGTIALTNQAIAFGLEFSGPIVANLTVTAITKAVLAQVTTSTPHGLIVGDPVVINGVVGMTEINSLIGFVSSVVDPNNVTLSINSNGFTAYSSGGTMNKNEYFTDDKSGNLTSAIGGTGTINYATGAYTLNFNTAPINAGVIVDAWYYETPNTKTIIDFITSPATPFNQFDGGGDIMAVMPFDQVQYAFHMFKSWYVNANGTPQTNLPYRTQLGTPNFRGAFSTDDGIVFLDSSVPSEPRVKTLTIDNNSATAVITVVPVTLSDSLDLTPYGFTTMAMFHWGDYDILECAATINGVVQAQNTVMFIRNIYSTNWDMLDYSASCFGQYNGTLLAGDSFSNNVFTLFSGYDDDGANITNYWQSKLFNLGSSGMKQFNRFVIKGLIQQTQNIDISFSFDNGNFITVQTISGTGSYVNLGNPVAVGSNTIGSQVIGGGSVATAYSFEYEFSVPAGIFEYVQAQFQATSIGYGQIDEFTFKDIRLKSRQILRSSI